MKILLVDDEYHKIEAVMETLRKNGLQEVQFEHRSNASDARVLLRNDHFNLLLIDLNLPAALGDSPQKDGGLAFLDLIRLDPAVKLPDDIIFLTGREDLLKEAEIEVLKRGALLYHFSAVSDRWRTALAARLKYIQDKITRNKEKYPAVDVVILTALRKPELEAVLKLSYKWMPTKFSDDPMNYHLGEISSDSRKISVVAASALSKGMPSAAALAAQMCVLFRPKYIVMLGICAGIKGRTNFGDVIVADPAWDWGSGKIAEGAAGERIFLSAPQQRPLDTRAGQRVKDMSESDAVLREIRSGWSGAVPSGTFQVRVGPMASGASVLANGASISEIAVQHRELLAIEMEAFAVMAAAEYVPYPQPVAMAIKAVCDFADTEKNDEWQSYASYTSAAFFDKLFRGGGLTF